MNVFIGLGSNIDPEKHLKAAAELLRNEWHEIHFSPVYRSDPVGDLNQPAFLNAAAVIETDDMPASIQKKLQTIETALGKHITRRFGPRTIDLDLLLYGSEILPNTEQWKTHVESYKLPTTNYQLYVPHPRMHERRFVLEPLMELINPLLLHPMLNVPWRELANRVSEQRYERIGLRL